MRTDTVASFSAERTGALLANVALENPPAGVAEVLQATQALCEREPSIAAVALVGSWARGAGRPDSDVDLVVLTRDPASLLTDDGWFSVYGADTVLIDSRDFGLIQERRLRRADGLVVEVGVGGPEWAAADPPDAGTVRVIRDGIRILLDPDGLLERLTAAVHQLE